MTTLETPSGVPVLIKVPNVDVNKQPRKSQLLAINENISDSSQSRQALQRYFPRVDPSEVRTQWQIGGVTGVAKPKKGNPFVFYLPVVVLRSNMSDEESNQAVSLLAKDFYREAKKKYEVIPLTDLQKAPKQ